MFSYWQGGGRKKLKNMPKPTQFFMLFRCGLGLQIYPWLTPYRVSQMALVNKEPIYQRRRPKRRKCNPWVRKTPWRRAWQSTPVFLPEEPRGQRSLTGTVHRFLNSQTRLEWLSSHTRHLVLPAKIEHKPRHCDELFSSSLSSLCYGG